jgi:spore maturation protein SpmB
MPATAFALALAAAALRKNTISSCDAAAAVQVFGSLEDSMMQLFTIMFGDVQFSTLKTIMNVNTVRKLPHQLWLNCEWPLRRGLLFPTRSS